MAGNRPSRDQFRTGIDRVALPVSVTASTATEWVDVAWALINSAEFFIGMNKEAENMSTNHDSHDVCGHVPARSIALRPCAARRDCCWPIAWRPRRAARGRAGQGLRPR